MKDLILIAIISLSILSACKKENQTTAPAGENKQNLAPLLPVKTNKIWNS